MLLTTLMRFIKPIGMLAAMGIMTAPLVQAQEAYQYEDLRHYDDDRGMPEVQEEDRVDPNAFNTALTPYGQWVEVEGYGRCWTPVGVAATWRPYTVGYWTYTTCGWMWMTAEPWGWATYHYGRWVLVPHHGWVWVPGRVWAPAWVTWRCGEGYVGWAPLPPVRTRAVVAFNVNLIPATAYTFVEERCIVDRDIHHRAIPVERNITIINRTTNITKVEVENHRVINRGVPVDRIERVTGRKIDRVDVREVRRPMEDRNRLVTGHVAMERRPAATVEVREAKERRAEVEHRANVPVRYAGEGRAVEVKTPAVKTKVAEREERAAVKVERPVAKVEAASTRTAVRGAEARDRQVAEHRATPVQTRGAVKEREEVKGRENGKGR